MSSLQSGVSACCIGLSCLFGVPSAHAEEPQAPSSKIGISYQAPAGCPGVSTFMLLLAEHLKGQDNAPLYAHVKISEAAPLHRLELTVYASPLPMRSEETGSSCDELVRLAAFMAAVARTQPSPREALTDLSEYGASSEEETREPPPVAPPAIAHRAPDVAPRAARLRWLAAGQFQGGVGLLPGVTFGTGPLVELAWQSFALRAAGSWWVPSEAASTGSLDSLAPLTLTLQSVDLAACLRHSMYEGATHELSFGACAVVSGYRFGTESRQLGGSSDVAYRAGGGGSVGAMWALPGELEVGAELGLSELSAPFRVQVAPFRESIYESRGSKIRFALLVGFRFGGGG